MSADLFLFLVVLGVGLLLVLIEFGVRCWRIWREQYLSQVRAAEAARLAQFRSRLARQLGWYYDAEADCYVDVATGWSYQAREIEKKAGVR